MEWISSAGGPLILLELRLTKAWGGVLWSVTPGARGNDYARACAGSSYASAIEVGDGWGLVLGDQPCATTWIQRDDRREGALVRALWADQQDNAADRAAALSFDPHADEERLAFHVQDDALVLFDSAMTGEQGLDDGLRLRVRSRSFIVGTRACKPDERTAFVLHEFYRQPH